MKIYNTKFLPLGIFIIITLSYVICETPAGNSTVSPKGTSATTVGLVAEGGLNKNIIPPVRLNGREGYTPAPTNATTKNVITPVIEPANIYNATESEKNETINKDHKSVPRKGAPIVEKNNTTTIPKKPTITEPGNKEPFAPSHFVTGNSNSSSVYVPKVPNIDIYSNNQDNTQKYIVPIVIIILSVPFVAILISIIYKRGAEWWKYRHYRRMDFLINGLYDN